jgi:nucleoside-diphosphate-sugar epimerase
MSARILVTGAAGFVGRHLVAALRSQGYFVQTHSLADGDLTSCSLEYTGITHAFHLAGKTFVPDSWAVSRSFYEAKVVATANLLEFCRCSHASVTFVSSYVYGTPVALPVAEDHPLQAFNPYSHSKILAEEICTFYMQQHGTRIAVVRPFNVYGPGQDERFLIPVLLRQALAQGSGSIEVADDRPRRDFLYISDLIDLLLATVAHSASGTYNAASGVSTSIHEIVSILNAIAPFPKELVSRRESRPREIFDVVGDIRKAGRDLHWKPTIDMATGLRLTAAGTLRDLGTSLSLRAERE